MVLLLLSLSNRKHMSMVSRAIFSDSPEMLKSSNGDLKTTYNTFQDCRMCIFPMTFLEIAEYGQKLRKLPKMRESDFLTSATRSRFCSIFSDHHSSS